MEQLYANLLQTQKDLLVSASKRKGEIPRDRPSKQGLCHDFALQLLSARLKGDQDHQVLATFIPPSYLPCTKAIDKLEQSKVAELQLETHHRGKYLLVKCLTPSRKLGAIMAIVEDQDEECVLLQLYGREHESERPTSEILKEGMIIAIKEPYFKVNGTGGYSVRVGHVGDILWLSDHDELVPAKWGPAFLEVDKPASKWKDEGDEAMREKKYWDAIERYTEALKFPITASTTTNIVRLQSHIHSFRFSR